MNEFQKFQELNGQFKNSRVPDIVILIQGHMLSFSDFSVLYKKPKIFLDWNLTSVSLMQMLLMKNEIMMRKIWKKKKQLLLQNSARKSEKHLKKAFTRLVYR